MAYAIRNSTFEQTTGSTFDQATGNTLEQPTGSAFDAATGTSRPLKPTNLFGTQFIVSRVLIVSIFIVCSVCGNGLVLLVNRKQKKQSGRQYIVALAWVDICACLFVLPQTPLYEIGVSF